ncbi:type VI secretion system tip protein VgrG [Maridesulfovibrio sp.]|uniref:type VI secretion system tip protein VgrG n=1 Tax=Maridesulfovibrio sp. TaxID=2795000 RepID=UPI0039F039A3
MNSSAEQFDMPTFSILIDGKELGPEFQVVSILVLHEFNRIPFARIQLEDGSPAKRTFQSSESSMLDPGGKLSIKAGYGGEEKPIFEGVLLRQQIRVTPNGSRLILEARDKVTAMARSSKNRVFLKQKDSDVVATLCSDYGVTAKSSATPVVHPQLAQVGITDWDFIRLRMQAVGHLIKVSGGELATAPPDASGSSVASFSFGESIIDLESSVDSRDSLAKTSVESWNHAEQKLTSVNGTQVKVSDFGDLSPAKLSKAVPSSVESNYAGRLLPEEMQALAKSQLLKSRLAKIRGRVRVKGLSKVQVGSFITLEGLGKHFSGDVYVSGVRHEIGQGLWNMDLQFGLDPEWFFPSSVNSVSSKAKVPVISPVEGLQSGVVTKLHGDPDGQDRICVRLPLIGKDGDEGFWARVACFDAGNSRGAFFRPEVGDEVLVGFMGDDPRHPVVLAMLNSSAKPAPLKPEDDKNDLKGIYTRSGMKVVFDDKNKDFSITTPAGNEICLSEKDQKIQVLDQNKNSITMSSSGIEMDSCADISLKAKGKIVISAGSDLSMKGLNVTGEASAKLALKGSAGSELSSSAVTVVKGSLVTIN